MLRSGTDSTVAVGAGEGLACAGPREQPEKAADRIATARVPRTVTLGGVLELGMLLSQVTDKQRSRLGLSPLLARARVAVRPVVGRPYQDGQDAHAYEQLGDVKPTHGTTLRPDYSSGEQGGRLSLGLPARFAHRPHASAGRLNSRPVCETLYNCKCDDGTHKTQKRHIVTRQVPPYR